MNNNGNPLISVVVPTYNHAHFLSRALQSVLDQSYTNWEAIVIDNHSDDNTEEVVEGFRDGRFKLLKINNEGVIAASRNMGIYAAKGEWIAFLDSDDWWYPGKLEISLHSVQQDKSVTVCSTDELKVNRSRGTSRLLRYGPFCSDFYQTLLLFGNRLSPSASLVNREFLVRNSIYFRERKDFATVEDFDFWLLLAQAGAVFKFVRSIQGEYTIHAANSSNLFEKHQENLKNVLFDHTYNIQKFEQDKSKLWRQISAGLLAHSAMNHLTKGSYFLAMRDLSVGLRISITRTSIYLFVKAVKMIALTSYIKYHSYDRKITKSA